MGKRLSEDKRRLLTNLTLLLVTILVFLLASEITIRVLGVINGIDYRLYMKELRNSKRLPPEIYMTDSGLVRLKPNTQVLATTSDFSIIYKTNNHGLRDKDYEYRKPVGKTRILAFGDSITFGEGVEYGERFTDIPEANNPGLEIINLGVPGYGLDQELMLLEREGLKYSPDHVIIFINQIDTQRYSTNIIQNNSIILEKAVQKKPVSNADTIYLEKDNGFSQEDEGLILQNSIFLNYIYYNIQLYLLKNHLEKYDKDLWNTINNSQTDQLNGDMVKNRTILILEKFIEITEKEDIRLIIINIDPHTRLNYIMEIDENIQYHDLSQELKEESKKYDLTFKYDPHFNKKTHRYIGDRLIQIISEIKAN